MHACGRTKDATMACPLTLAKTATRTLTALLLGIALTASGPLCSGQAQGMSCSDNCRAAFGACYKATANRTACELQLLHCLEACHMSKRG